MKGTPSAPASPLVPLGAIAALALGLLWLTGALSAALFGGGWKSVSLSELLLTATRLPSHPAEPALAWPEGHHALIPGATAFYGVGVTLLGLTAAAALLGLRAHANFTDTGGRRSSPEPASARWATGRDLKPLRVSGPTPGRLILGRHRRKLIAAEERQSVIVFAPSQSGKTTGLAIPALLEWQGPALVTSVKSDLVAATFAQREGQGKAMVFDPTAATGRGNVRASPLHACGTWQGALRVASWLSAAARPGGEGLSDADFWFKSAEKLLAPLLFAAATQGRTIGAVTDWLDMGRKAKAPVGEILASSEDPEFKAAELAWEANWRREERQRSSIYTTAETITAAFADPKVRNACAESQYTPTDLLDGGSNTLYLCAPAHEQQRLRPLFSLLVRELISVAYESSAATGKPIDPPLLLVLDELANIAPIPNLDEVASAGAGQGIQLLSILQDLNQLTGHYGDASAHSIVNNHRAKYFGSGTSDPATLSYLVSVTGAGSFVNQSETSDGDGSRTRTWGPLYRELAPANVVREARAGSGLLVYGRLPPARLSLRTGHGD